MAQRRHFHRDDIQPEKQIFAKRAFGHAFLKVAVGGRNDPHVSLAGDIFTEPFVFAFLQKAKSLG